MHRKIAYAKRVVGLPEPISLPPEPISKVDKVANMLAESNELIAAALFASIPHGAFATWLRENPDKHAIVKQFHGYFLPLLKHPEPFRHIALLRRQNTRDPASAAASVRTKADSEMSDFELLVATVSAELDVPHWETMDKPALIKKWKDFLSKKAEGETGLYYQTIIDFLSDNMYRLEPVKKAWEKEKEKEAARASAAAVPLPTIGSQGSQETLVPSSLESNLGRFSEATRITSGEVGRKRGRSEAEAAPPMKKEGIAREGAPKIVTRSRSGADFKEVSLPDSRLPRRSTSAFFPKAAAAAPAPGIEEEIPCKPRNKRARRTSFGLP